MKKFSYTEQDSTMQLIVLPLFVFILNWILLKDTYWHNWRVFAFATLVAGTIGYGNWIANNIAGNYINRNFPYFHQLPQRIVLLFLSAVLLISLAVTLDYGIYVWANSSTLPLKPGQLGWAFAFVLINTVVVIAIYESIMAFNYWQRTLIETEQLRKENLQSQLEGLKSQINPHFLFNSLNSLSSLIEDDPDRAQQFIEEMSSVYRYLLRSNETELATLQQEIQFAQSYFHLLNTRYGDGIRLDLAIDPQLETYLLPPLTLQILFENVVKHNIILPQQPLTIRVNTTPDGQLRVQNNLQRKSVRVPSNRIGLSNITAKYELLGQGTVLIEEEAQTFIVTLPLLVNST
ncbi:histidine kinase [Spirosoma sp. SC4-14]|uniref:sensor histidine kinase n=1 Tax=Spirosoma sp. SC4-14 TaxID=3128900 RepID=UPI0030CB9EB8